MALTPQDRAYYESRLGWKGGLYLLGVTVIMGGVLWPTLLFLQDYFNGVKTPWSWALAFALALSGMGLGVVVSMMMYLLARFYLWMGWLPRRR